MKRAIIEQVAKKKKINNEIAWMNRSPHPMCVYKTGSLVMVLWNGSWQQGVVLMSKSTAAQVKLVCGDVARIYDNRCLKPISE